MTMLKGIGPVSARRLLDTFDNPEQLFYLKKTEIQSLTGINSEILENSGRELALERADKILEQHCRYNIKSIVLGDDEYPLKLLHCPDAPLVLYKLGLGDLNHSKNIAIVGTRTSTSYGHLVTRNIVKDLNGEIEQITSGLAEGIDTEAHKASIEHGINTVAVLGHGLDRVYPSSNKELASEIIKNEGALISEFPVGVKPDRENFPKRNRIVAGMTNATIVVESSSKGGALITARLALDYNRDVFAVPGSLFNKASLGCNAMINQQVAVPYLNKGLFLKEMGWKAKKKKITQKSLPIGLNPIQSELYSFIRLKAPVSIDQISLVLNLSISKLNVELLQLELRGIIRSLPGCNYTI